MREFLPILQKKAWICRFSRTAFCSKAGKPQERINMYEFLFHRGPFSLQGKMKEVKPKNSHWISNNKAQFTRQIDTRPGLKIRNVKNGVSRSILGPGFLVNRVENSRATKFVLPLMMLFPERVISMALHVMLGTVMRTTSLLVCVDQIRISALAQVRIRSELSLKTHTQAS